MFGRLKDQISSFRFFFLVRTHSFGEKIETSLEDGAGFSLRLKARGIFFYNFAILNEFGIQGCGVGPMCLFWYIGAGAFYTLTYSIKRLFLSLGIVCLGAGVDCEGEGGDCLLLNSFN